MDKHDTVGCAEQVATKERRRHDREDVVPLDCSHGLVLDFSAGGLCLVSRKPLAGRIDLVLKRPAGSEIRVMAEVVWTTRVRFNEHLNGLQFIDGPLDMARQLRDDEVESQDG